MAINNWSEAAHYRVSLYAFMAQHILGQKRGQYVYIVHHSDVVYVGQTRKGVRLRLWDHFERGTTLGVWLHENKWNDSVVTQCEIIAVDGDLNAAEQHTISSLCPKLNIVQYKASSAMPPVSRCDMVDVDVKSSKYIRISVLDTPAYQKGVAARHARIT